MDVVVNGLLLWNNLVLALEKPTGVMEFKRCGCQQFGRQGIKGNVGFSDLFKLDLFYENLGWSTACKRTFLGV